LNIPERVQDLAAKQVEKNLEILWTWPLLTTEGARLEDVERFVVYGMPIANASQPPSPEAFDSQATEWRELTGAEIEPYGPGKKIELSIAAAEHIGKTYALAVRAESRRGRRGALSNIQVIELIEPPATPAVPAASTTPEGVALTWRAAERATAYRIYRQAPGGQEFQPQGEAASSAFNDASIQWGQTYQYRVRGLTQTSAGVTEGADSPTVEIIAKDTFPPAPPSDLRAVVTPTSVELSWRESAEPDFAGYRIRRRLADAAPTALNEQLLATPSFSDRTIQPGSTYRYTLTALDQNGNESATSESIEAVIP
jgi:fibronectin type 3 domain-containing protein